jgi:two-component system cell cycle response regulator CtrA
MSKVAVAISHVEPPTIDWLPEGYSFFGMTPEQAFAYLDINNIDLLIVDIKTVGLDHIRKLRGIVDSRGVIVAMVDRDDDPRSIWDAGADDVITAGAPKEERVARINAAFRRASAVPETHAMTIGGLTWHADGRLPMIEGKPVALTAKESDVLRVLFQAPGRVFSKNSIMHHIYKNGRRNGTKQEEKQKIIDVFICKIRKKLEQAGVTTNVIETVPGVGYKIAT